MLQCLTLSKESATSYPWKEQAETFSVLRQVAQRLKEENCYQSGVSLEWKGLVEGIR